MDLKFDEMTIDTRLAEQYLESNEKVLDLFNNYSTEVLQNEPYLFNGEAFLSNKTEYKTNVVEPPQQRWVKQRRFASSLQKNAELFSQLEYKIREIPVDDTNAQLELIIKLLQCSDLYADPEDVEMYFTLKNSLLSLAYALISCKNSTIHVDEQTAFVCHLFVKLCYEAGWRNLFVHFVYKSFNGPAPPSFLQRLNSGSVAVVCDDADVESAVDVLLTSSKMVPWHLRKVFVQESVYQVFMDALKWKCKQNENENNWLTSAVVNAVCSESHIHNNRIFLIDCIDFTQKLNFVITIESFRTTKEIITLLEKDVVQYLSLWSCDVGKINEISYNTTSPVVWVNNLGDFRGPPNISRAVFDVFHTTTAIEKSEYSKLLTMSQTWSTLTFEDRRKILLDVLEAIKSVMSEPVYNTIINILIDSSMPAFVDVGNDYVCVGITKPLGVIYTKENFITKDYFKSILYGNGLAVENSDVPTQVFEIFKTAGVPVIQVGSTKGSSYILVHMIQHGTAPLSTKTIWTNSGTIFAN